MDAFVDKAKALECAKRRAAWYLVGAAALFGVSLVWKGPPTWTMELLQAMSEAAMVGGLADWFAVAALFRPVNLFGLIPIFPSHTAVIPRSKERIAVSLGDFVREQFLKTETLVLIIKKNNPAQFVSNWFLQKTNAERFGRHGAKLLTWSINAIHEESVQVLISKTIREAFKDIELSRKTGEILEGMVSGGKHHELLDGAIAKITETLSDSATRESIALKIAESIRNEYPKAQYMVPTEAVGRFATNKLSQWIENYLKTVASQPKHAMREAFDKKANELIVHLKGDSKFAKKGDEIKEYILNDEKFNSYVRSLWGSLRSLIEKDLINENSEIHKRLVGAGDWIGKTLEKDEELRASLNRQAESLVEQFGPAFGTFVSGHIEDTVKGWEAKSMSMLIEQNIGTDLQKIRINGTIIGGFLGGLLYAIAYLVPH